MKSAGPAASMSVCAGSPRAITSLLERRNTTASSSIAIDAMPFSTPWPWPLLPHVTTVPTPVAGFTFFSATVWKPPADTSVQFSTPAGTIDCVKFGV